MNPASDMVLDLPPPISVNRLRKIYWPADKSAQEWREHADRYVMVAKSRKEVRFERLTRFELHVVMSEDHTKIDLDNGLKLLIDYLHQRDIVANDARENMRRIVVEWGHAPAGCRITIKPIAPSTMKDVLRATVSRSEAHSD